MMLKRDCKLPNKSLESTSISDLNKEGLQGRIAVIRAYISARTGDLSRTIHFSSQALKLLPQRDLNWRSVAATTIRVWQLVRTIW